MTPEQLRLMAHALGYRPEKGSWLLEPYRNFYLSYDPVEEWEAAVEQRLATVTRLAEDSPWGSRFSYKVTPAGIKAVLDELSQLSRTDRYKLLYGTLETL